MLDECGVYIHPYISTVTYLSDVGAPTVVIDAKVTPEGELMGDSLGTANDDDDNEDSELAEAPNQQKDNETDIEKAEHLEDEGREFEVFASYPVVGKHLAFNGRLLHGCPSSCTLPLLAEGTSGKSSKGVQKAAMPMVGDTSTRVSLLVNIWLNHKPLGLEAITAADPPVSTVKDHSARAAAAAAKLRPYNATLWSLGDGGATAATQHQQPIARLDTETLAKVAEVKGGVAEVEGGADGFPVGGVGQRLLGLQLPVAAFQKGLTEGQHYFGAHLRVMVGQDDERDSDEQDSDEGNIEDDEDGITE